MEIRVLRYFLETAREGTITRAAERLHVTQPTMSNKGRAFHPRAINSNGIWSSTTPYGFFDFDLMAHVEELSPRPLLLITGDKAHSRYHSENVYERAKEPKELIVMPGATHCDLYDIYEKIPFERLDGFFTKHLGK